MLRIFIQQRMAASCGGAPAVQPPQQALQSDWTGPTLPWGELRPL